MPEPVKAITIIVFIFYTIIIVAIITLASTLIACSG